MDTPIAKQLLQLNAEFYQTFATQFSDTRQRIQPGVQRILEFISLETSILDLGCGNGELARVLAERGFRSTYLGIDFSSELLNVARKGVDDHPNFSFIQRNLAVPNDGWEVSVKKFDIVLSFAAMHHIPGKESHLQILQSVRNLLMSEGCFIHSNWQFLNSERLRKRIHPWSEVGLTNEDVDPGDYLLDWRRGGFGLRYVHHFSESELITLAEETGFSVVETFYSDGETGDLGLYQIWKLAGS